MAVQKIKNHEEAANMASEIERLEAVLKTMKAELKVFVEEFGPVDTGNEVWDFYPSVSWKFDEVGLRRMAEGMALEGINPWQMLSISSGDRKKLGWSDDVLAQFGEKKETKRFASRKK